MVKNMAEKMVSSKAKNALQNEEDALLGLNDEDYSSSKKKGKDKDDESQSKKSNSSRTASSSSTPSSHTSSSLGSRTSQRKKASASSSNTSQNPPNNDEAILAMLQNIQEGQNSQNNKIQSLVDRMENLENDMYYDDNEGDEEYDNEEYDDDNTVQDEQEPGPSGSNVDKRKADDDSLFSSMTKRFKIKEVTSADVDKTLAENITDLFRNGMDTEQYNELTKEDANARPDNCPGLSIVRTNRLVWDQMSNFTQQNDKKLQTIEKTIIKAATIMTKTVNDMAKDEANINRQYIENCNDSLALLGHCNRQVNLLRKDLIKPDLRWDYVHLCAHSVPYTENLFGDDVSKSAKEIETCNKLGRNIGRGHGGRGGWPPRGGGGGYRHVRGRGGRGAGSRGRGAGRGSSAGADRNSGGSKNLRRGGTWNY